MNDLEMDVSYDHSSEVELWGVLLCAQRVPRPHTHTLTHRQTDRQERERWSGKDREGEREKGAGANLREGGREERTPPCLLHTRDSGALVTSCLFKHADCIVITDWLKPFSFLSVCPPLPSFLFHSLPFFVLFLQTTKGTPEFHQGRRHPSSGG